MDEIRLYRVGGTDPLRSGVALTGAYADGLVEAFLVLRGFEPLAFIRHEASPRTAAKGYLDRLLGEAGVDLMEPVAVEPIGLDAARPLLAETPIRGAFRELLRQTQSRTLQRLEADTMGRDWLHRPPGERPRP